MAKKITRDDLFSNHKNGFDRIKAGDKKQITAFSEDYKAFLNSAKTERESVSYAIRLAGANGFRAYTRGDALKPGDKIYQINRERGLILAVIGSDDLRRGANIVAAHMDVPRIDIKPVPLYEESDLAFFKTHYYGGIRKYQWVAIPLELHGVIVLKSGEVKHVCIGTDPADPVFTITDLLPHLAGDQSKKTLGESFTGEVLNALVGSEPEPEDDGTDRIKLRVLRILNDTFGVTEDDLKSAELSLVPAFDARDVGFDRSMVGGYGHDDRICGYAGLRALLDMEAPKRTSVLVLADKEEIGSEGVTGMQSAHFDTFMADLATSFGLSLNELFERSCCLSADVTSAFDPGYADAYDRRNTSFFNHGIGVCKYTGARGKSGASDASAELVARFRRILDGADVLWQMATLGKVDGGGGGTVAMFMAKRNIDTIDAGVPVLSMHAPFEVVSKLDTYMAYRGMKAFFEEP